MKAVLTIAHNESLFLPIWYNYYKKYFNDEDIYILDHDSNDGSTDLSCNIVKVYNDKTYDHDWLLNTVQDFQEKLLKDYEIVAFAEADEIILHKNGLDKFLDEFRKSKAEAVRCTGYDLLHIPKEPDFNLNKDVLRQRKYWYYNGGEVKVLISKTPIKWRHGQS